MTVYHNKKKYWLGVTRFLFIAITMTMVDINMVRICTAAETVCEKLLSGEVNQTVKRDQIKQIQQSLKATGYAPQEIEC